MPERVSEQNTKLKITTFEGWVHKNVDKSIEFCNDCPINAADCNLACPYRDALFVHLSDLKNWLKQKCKEATERRRNGDYFVGNQLITELLEDLEK